jgi:SAM-dependent methyltransferase
MSELNNSEVDYHSIFKHYEACLDKHGNTALGVDWPNIEDLKTRFDVMLDVKRGSYPAKVLDFGCGIGLLYDHIIESKQKGVSYIGLDISPKFIEASKCRHPDTQFYCVDILKDTFSEEFDYAICNGTFTEKLNLSFDDMFDFFSSAITKLFEKAKVGIAFNVMSSHVDYERDDLFHLPHDTLADFIITNLSRNYIIRNDYGLYEYTAYVYKESYGR